MGRPSDEGALLQSAFSAVLYIRGCSLRSYPRLLSVDGFTVAGVSLFPEAELTSLAERALGHTLGEEIRQMRLTAAKELVAETDLPIADIAESCGFTSVSHLALRFRENLGVTPLAWRRQSRQT